ncbi:MAG: SDR family oxidoreductase [Planctomycetota bacterium]|jgi:UDP-glucose 4-epimerase
MTRYLITGGAGFIGSNLAEALLDEGKDVAIFDNFSTGRRENVDELDGLDVIEGDLRNYDEILAALKGVDIVFHEAALPSVAKSILDPVKSNKNNIDGTVNLLLAAKDQGVKKVVYAGSSSAYGDSETLPKIETMRENPISPYAVNKLTAEQFCRVFSKVYGLDTAVLRYFNIFGPRQDPSSPYSGVISLFVTKLLAGEQPVIYGDGEQSRDFTFIANVVSANFLAADSGPTRGETFNIACGAAVTVNRLFEIIRDLTGARGVEPIYAEPRQGDVRHSLADISKARAAFGYQPLVDLEEGLRQTVEWYRKKGAENSIPL